jgi:large subunit ribosomal protein L15
VTLKLHHLRPAPGAKTAKTRVGRGEGSKGKTAGRGTKGSKARNNIPAYFEGGQLPLHMRLPKLKGFKNPFREEYQVVNLDRIGELFPEGGSITVDELVAKGAVRKGQRVKVLGQGEIEVAVQVSAQAFYHHRVSHDQALPVVGQSLPKARRPQPCQGLRAFDVPSLVVSGHQLGSSAGVISWGHQLGPSAGAISSARQEPVSCLLGFPGSSPRCRRCEDRTLLAGRQRGGPAEMSADTLVQKEL